MTHVANLKKPGGKDKLSNGNHIMLGYFRDVQSMAEKQVHVPPAKNKQMNLDGEVSKSRTSG